MFSSPSPETELEPRGSELLSFVEVNANSQTASSPRLGPSQCGYSWHACVRCTDSVREVITSVLTKGIGSYALQTKGKKENVLVRRGKYVYHSAHRGCKVQANVEWDPTYAHRISAVAGQDRRKTYGSKSPSLSCPPPAIPPSALRIVPSSVGCELHQYFDSGA